MTKTELVEPPESLVSLTTFVPPSIFLHIVYHCLMGVIVRGHVYSLSADTTEVPDFAVLYSLVVAFTPRYLFYPLDIRVYEPQRLLYEISG